MLFELSDAPGACPSQGAAAAKICSVPGHKAPGQLRCCLHYLRTLLSGGVCPLPIEVGACCIGAQVPSPGAVWIHVGDHVEDCISEQLLGQGIMLVMQSVQQPLHITAALSVP